MSEHDQGAGGQPERPAPLPPIDEGLPSWSATRSGPPPVGDATRHATPQPPPPPDETSSRDTEGIPSRDSEEPPSGETAVVERSRRRRRVPASLLVLLALAIVAAAAGWLVGTLTGSSTGEGAIIGAWVELRVSGFLAG